MAAFCATLTAGQASDALALLAPDVTWWVGGSVPGLSGVRRGADVHDLVRNVLVATTDGCLVVTPRAWTVDGPRVALEALVAAQLRSGRAYRNEYHFAFTVGRAGITSVRAYLDTEHLRATFFEALD
ncbi:nuclear transport factor 2 family protein [Nocardioides carbamazepini]|uniref:nuclear transport factor 2 family protein n=1 Tax=Nocardioides carbamazepini TaxID=2854259 RepID=UPI002149CB84|nr:nuclear transport factor 2 family protein [Nocardioides carbamazepini]MCR1783798.1 nuclear transport factor 2 family protein [Nocardioides carbamazepini]